MSSFLRNPKGSRWGKGLCLLRAFGLSFIDPGLIPAMPLFIHVILGEHYFALSLSPQLLKKRYLHSGTVLKIKSNNSESTYDT